MEIRAVAPDVPVCVRTVRTRTGILYQNPGPLYPSPCTKKSSPVVSVASHGVPAPLCTLSDTFGSGVASNPGSCTTWVGALKAQALLVTTQVQALDMREGPQVLGMYVGIPVVAVTVEVV